MAPHSSTLAWKIPWTEEAGRLQSIGSWRVGHDWVTSLSLFTCIHWRRKWQPTPVFLPGESQGRGSLWAAVYGVSQSWTWLKRLSSSSSNSLLTYRWPPSHFLLAWPWETDEGTRASPLCPRGTNAIIRAPPLWPCLNLTWWCDHSPGARHPGVQSHMGLRKHHYEQS